MSEKIINTNIDKDIIIKKLQNELMITKFNLTLKEKNINELKNEIILLKNNNNDDDKSPKIKSLEKELILKNSIIEELNIKIGKRNTSLNHLRFENEELKQENKDLRQENEKLMQEINKLNITLQQKQINYNDNKLINKIQELEKVIIKITEERNNSIRKEKSHLSNIIERKKEKKNLRNECKEKKLKIEEMEKQITTLAENNDLLISSFNKLNSDYLILCNSYQYQTFVNNNLYEKNNRLQLDCDNLLANLSYIESTLKTLISLYSTLEKNYKTLALKEC